MADDCCDKLIELIKQFTVIRLLVVLVNAAVVLFLIYRVRQKGS
jgi:hypothetical protein